jgi:small subunit ribosomal protein S21|tara:strand:+ start:297 stop:509 length:213 start_codon:yes stop_codon:yes gene_type:complete
MSGYTIEVRNNNVEKALRVLKKKLLKDGVMKELRDRQYYQKPSFKKREKKKENIRRHKKDQKIKALKGEL